jgi:uncharacterized delta-60 repeat protein
MKYLIFLFLLIASCSAFGQNVFVDPSFTMSVNNPSDCSEKLQNGKIIIGKFGSGPNSIIQINEDGTIDPSINFGTGFTGGPNPQVVCIKSTPDGKILVGGSFTTYNGSPILGLARLYPDGTLDTTFPGLPFQGPGWVNDVEIDESGKYLIGGNFFTNQFFNNFMCVEPNGTVDTTFIGNGQDVYGEIYDIEILDNNDIIIAGNFNQYNNLTANRIIALNSDGSIDNSYNFGNGANNSIFDITIQLNQKIVLAGFFTQFNGSNSSKICRLNQDGSLDATFNSGTGFPNNSYIWETYIKEDGKILVGGEFNSYNGVNRRSLIQLNNDGSVDMNFDTGIGFNNGATLTPVKSLIILENEQILVGGYFTSFNGQTAPYYCRLTVCENPSNEVLNISSCAPYISPTNQSYSQSGIYNETILSSLGCDSVNLTINLTILNSLPTTFSQTICGGTSFEWNGQLYNQSGQYTQTLVNQSGCDSIVTMDLSVNYITNAFSEVLCYGNSYTWNGQDYSQTGQYSQTLSTPSGCDSIVTLDLTVYDVSVAPTPAICIVGLDSLTNDNRIIWEKFPTGTIDSFFVYKETTISNIYEKIGAVDYDDLAVLIDPNSDPMVQAYRYKLSALDTCGLETALSDPHKTIHLSINQGVGNSWNLNWSHYEGINFGSYTIYRGTDPSNITALTTIQSNLNSYTDLNAPLGGVFYQIEVVNPNSCDPTKMINYGVSRSNIVTNQNSSIDEQEEKSVIIYPNPTNSIINIEVESGLVGQSYEVKDNLGRIVLKGIIINHLDQIHLREFSKGIYVLTVSNSNKIYRIIKN